MFCNFRSHRTGKSFRIILVGVFLLAGSFLAVAQDPPQPPAPDQGAASGNTVIKTESRIVLVDAVVTDKKGNYLRDLKQQDFKVFEDNKEQTITSFSGASDPSMQQAGQKRYVILFFDNSSMEMPDQIQARAAAGNFIEKNTDPDRLMAVAEYGGSLRIKQNFTSNGTLLKAAVSGLQTPNLQTNNPATAPSIVASNNPLVGIGNAESDLAARSMLLSIRSLAKNLRSVPGRKMLILFSAGFPLDTERMSELTATIDACNKANVAVYALDVRGLVAPMPGGTSNATPGGGASFQSASNDFPIQVTTDARPHFVLMAGYTVEPQKPGGGGGGGTGGGTGGGAAGGGGHGGTGGGAAGGGGHGGTGGTGGTGSTGGSGGKGGNTGTSGTTGSKGGTGTSANPNPYNNMNNFSNNPMNQPRSIVPDLGTSVATNQQILQALSEGTGGFSIYNTNDLLGALDRIARDQNEFYVLGYVPPPSSEAACHTLKVKLNRGGTEVRSRSGYCNSRPANPLEGKPIEKQMEIQAASGQSGSIHGVLTAPYFYTAPNIARVNLTMQIPGDALAFNKEKGKYHSGINVLGIASKSDGSIGARFSDTLNVDLEKDEAKEFAKQPFRYENQFDAAPGSYKLTIVFSAGGEAFGRFETPLQIDPYDGNKLSLGGLVLSNRLQKIDQISTQVDTNLLEDRTPLIIKGFQITPSADDRFKKTDNVILYSELYEPKLKSEQPEKVVAGYRIFDSNNKEVFFSGPINIDDFIQKGNPVVPVGFKVQVKDLPLGSYRLALLATNDSNEHPAPREASFTIVE